MSEHCTEWTESIILRLFGLNTGDFLVFNLEGCDFRGHRARGSCQQLVEDIMLFDGLSV